MDTISQDKSLFKNNTRTDVMLKVYFDPKSGPTATERGGPKPDFSNLEVKFWNEYSVAMNSIT